ncbi:MAG: hypothetical protein QXU88_00450 [Candidatus Woesearchaeota archaeon]
MKKSNFAAFVSGLLVGLLLELAAGFSLPRGFSSIVLLVGLLSIFFTEFASLELHGSQVKRFFAEAKDFFLFSILVIALTSLLATNILRLSLAAGLVLGTLLIGWTSTVGKPGRAFALLLPFLIVDVVQTTSLSNPAILFGRLAGGFGAGFIMGLVFLRLLHNQRHKVRQKSFFDEPIVLLGVALLAFSLAFAMQGNGFVAVATFSAFFCIANPLHNSVLKRFENTFTRPLTIFCLFVSGIALAKPALKLTSGFFTLSAFVLFAGVLLARLLALASQKKPLQGRQRAFELLLPLPAFNIIIALTLLLSNSYAFAEREIVVSLAAMVFLLFAIASAIFKIEK